MGTPQHGYSTEPPGDMIEALFNTGCAACYEMARGSEFMIALNSEPATPGRRASSTQVIITNDEVATPVSSQYLAESERVANVTLQDQCPIHGRASRTGHRRPRLPVDAARPASQGPGRSGPTDRLRRLIVQEGYRIPVSDRRRCATPIV